MVDAQHEGSGVNSEGNVVPQPVINGPCWANSNARGTHGATRAIMGHSNATISESGAGDGSKGRC